MFAGRQAKAGALLAVASGGAGGAKQLPLTVSPWRPVKLQAVLGH